jgi:hypothetical protein
LEDDPDVSAIILGKFKPFSVPSLKAVRAQDQAFAQLVQTLAFTRFPRHCNLVVVAKKGLSAYMKLLAPEESPDESPSDGLKSDDVPSEQTFPLARSASGRTIPLHRWVLAIAAHISHSEHDFASALALLEQLKARQPGAQLSACEQKLATSLESQAAGGGAEVFGKRDPLKAKFDDVTRGYSKEKLEPIETLMGFIGVQSVKQLSLDMYSIAKDRERLRRDGRQKSIVQPRLNFAFVGNPGCGKTESARLFAKVLVKSDLRQDTFIEMTAQQAIQMGEVKFCDLMSQSNLAPPKSKANDKAPDAPKGKFLKNEAVEARHPRRAVYFCNILRRYSSLPADRMSRPRSSTFQNLRCKAFPTRPCTTFGWRMGVKWEFPSVKSEDSRRRQSRLVVFCSSTKPTILTLLTTRTVVGYSMKSCAYRRTTATR